MTTVFLLLFAFLGALLSSALDCLVWRQEKGEAWFSGRSHCDRCGKPLRLRDLMPLFGFLFRGGKTSCCHAREVPWHFLLECLGAFGFLFAAAEFLETRDASLLLRDLLLIAFAISTAAKDLFSGLVSIPLTGTAILLFLFWPTEDPSLILRILGLWVGAALMLIPYLITSKKGVGGGDVWLGALLGAVLGAWKVWPALALAFILGGGVAATLLLTKQKKRTDAIPFGPFLILALLLVHFF